MGFIYAPFSLAEASKGISKLTLPEIGDQDFDWEFVRKAYDPSPDFINLENGYFSPQIREDYEKFVGYGRELNQRTSNMMRSDLDDETLETRKAMAEFCGVDLEEIVLTRNTTESLNIVINGLELQKGDEAVITDQCYPNMINAFRQREKRDSIVVKEISLPMDPVSDDELVNAYEKAITPKTKVILVTHMINLTGQVLPCKKISEMAHSRGVEVIVDAAHSFAHVDFQIRDLGADYVGTSLHKWLCAPVGSGLLYIKKEHVSKVWPLFGDVENDPENIRKFERQGTQPLGTRRGIRNAIEFHKFIGGRRKEERLRSNTTYWTQKARSFRKIIVNTPEDPNRYAGLGNFRLKGSNPGPVSKALFDDYRIMTVPVDTKSVTGIRVTPHLYNTEEHLEKLLFALERL